MLEATSASSRFTFERTLDYELVRRIVTHPKIYRWMHSDGAPAPEEYRPPEMDSIWYVVVKDAEEVLGLFLIVPQTNVCAQVHACLLPGGRNGKAVLIYRSGIQWLFDHSSFEKLIGFTPSYNFAALHVAEAAGMERIGVITSSLRKFGKLQDQVIFGIGRPSYG